MCGVVCGVVCSGCGGGIATQEDTHTHSAHTMDTAKTAIKIAGRLLRHFALALLENEFSSNCARRLRVPFPSPFKWPQASTVQLDVRCECRARCSLYSGVWCCVCSAPCDGIWAAAAQINRMLEWCVDKRAKNRKQVNTETHKTFIWFRYRSGMCRAARTFDSTAVCVCVCYAFLLLFTPNAAATPPTAPQHHTW